MLRSVIRQPQARTHPSITRCGRARAHGSLAPPGGQAVVRRVAVSSSESFSDGVWPVTHTHTSTSTHLVQEHQSCPINVILFKRDGTAVGQPAGGRPCCHLGRAPSHSRHRTDANRKSALSVSNFPDTLSSKKGKFEFQSKHFKIMRTFAFGMPLAQPIKPL